MYRILPLLAAALALAAPLEAWGALGHRMLAEAALADLPPGPGAWFRGREALVLAHANDPDDWKHGDPRERARHRLRCEPYGGPGGVPRLEAEAVARLGPERFLKCGRAPWAVQERVRSLTTAFRTGDALQVAFEAAILSHYVGDLNVPLHATVNHDGHRTGQTGVHHRWEIGLVDRLAAEGWRPPVATVDLGPDPWGQPWGWLEDSFQAVPAILADDLAAGDGQPQEPDQEPSEAYWRTFQDLQGTAVRRQLIRSGRRTARMILLAWMEAGSPTFRLPKAP